MKNLPLSLGLLLVLLQPFSSPGRNGISEVRPVAVTVAGNNVDSPAIWVAPNPADSLVLLTEKGGGAVMVFKADRQATFVRRFGDFKRPNGISIIQGVSIGEKKRDLAFVTDRDGNSVSIFSIPDFEKLGVFAEDVVQPMGVSVISRNRTLQAYIIPKKRVGDAGAFRYRISESNGKLVGTRDLTFGKELSVGQETVMADTPRNRLYVADESAQDIVVYTLDGKFIRRFGKGVFQAQVEGIVVVETRNGPVLIASDQLERTEFEFFDIRTSRHLGTTVTTAMRTDGIAVFGKPLPDFPTGLFVAQSDPEGTGGKQAEYFDLESIFPKRSLKSSTGVAINYMY